MLCCMFALLKSEVFRFQESMGVEVRDRQPSSEFASLHLCANQCSVLVNFRSCRHSMQFTEDSVSGNGPSEIEIKCPAASP